MWETTGDALFHQRRYYGYFEVKNNWWKNEWNIFVSKNASKSDAKGSWPIKRHYVTSWEWERVVQTESFCLHTMLNDGLGWCVLCDVFISSLDSHSDGTHSLQSIHWWASDPPNQFWWRNKLIHILDGNLKNEQFSKCSCMGSWSISLLNSQKKPGLW